jgi:hypothetical protein
MSLCRRHAVSMATKCKNDVCVPELAIITFGAYKNRISLSEQRTDAYFGQYGMFLNCLSIKERKQAKRKEKSRTEK